MASAGREAAAPAEGESSLLTRPSWLPSKGSTPPAPRGRGGQDKDAKLRKSCNCRNSRCLKLYCECFASGQYCFACNCQACHNNHELHPLRHSRDGGAPPRELLRPFLRRFLRLLAFRVAFQPSQDRRSCSSRVSHWLRCRCGAWRLCVLVASAAGRCGHALPLKRQQTPAARAAAAPSASAAAAQYAATVAAAAAAAARYNGCSRRILPPRVRHTAHPWDGARHYSQVCCGGW